MRLRLAGPRLVLRAMTASDLRDARPLSEPDLTPFVAAQLRDDPAARGWWTWSAAAVDGVEVGRAGFGGRPTANRRLTLGYEVHPEFRGRGYATEMVRLLTGWAFERREVDRVRLTIRPDNAPSLRVAQKCGYAETGERVFEPPHGELLVFERAR